MVPWRLLSKRSVQPYPSILFQVISNSLDPPSVFSFFFLFNYYFFKFFNFGTNHEENLLFKYFSQKLTFTDFGKVSQRGYQTLIIKGRIKFTMNSFNLQSFSAQLSVGRRWWFWRDNQDKLSLWACYFLLSVEHGDIALELKWLMWHSVVCYSF